MKNTEPRLPHCLYWAGRPTSSTLRSNSSYLLAEELYNATGPSRVFLPTRSPARRNSSQAFSNYLREALQVTILLGTRAHLCPCICSRSTGAGSSRAA
eukprot:6607784-Pyramimonas_sp.AAC.1